MVQPGPHLVEQLESFPDTNLTLKQIQQFLGIINYVRDFIPRCANHTSQLSKLLKKQVAYNWGPDQTAAVKALKEISKNPPPLKIPEKDSSLILQTDASDFHWGALLIEQDGRKKYYCGHASGSFSSAKQNYHTIHKEILAVKRGIQKFEFHLIPREFIVQMNNSSFPKILDFKNKPVPDQQLARWQAWFSKYKFHVQHIKGVSNIIADLLSRPRQEVNSIALITPATTIPMIYMMHPCHYPLSRPATKKAKFPPGFPIPTTPAEVQNMAK